MRMFETISNWFKEKGTNWILLCLIGIGPLFIVVGYHIAGAQKEFVNRSEIVTLLVTNIESKITSSGTVSGKDYREYLVYRPVFRLVYHRDEGRSYAGSLWQTLSLHQKDEVVSGRYDAASGKMMSNALLQSGQTMSLIFYGLGAMVTLIGAGIVIHLRRKRKKASA